MTLYNPATQPSGPVNHQITTANVAVTVFSANSIPYVGDIINPPDAPATLYIDAVTTAVAGSATSIPLMPGSAYRVSRPILSAVTAVSSSAGHSFVAVKY